MIQPITQDEVQRVLSMTRFPDVARNLLDLSAHYKSNAVFSTSFSLEDQVIAHMIFTQKLDIQVFTLDTGRLFEETYSTWSRTLEKYRQPIHAYYPDTASVQELVTMKGPNSFYESVDNRKECCYIRKVEPLKRAIKDKQVWITGIRAEHSANRHNMPQVEWDGENNIVKYHPLLHWTTAEVRKWIDDNHIPYNPLQDKGFVSIGCAPCTRAIKPGEDFRAGRWWWEDKNKKECGLHVHG